jgi:hypothetical protein
MRLAHTWLYVAFGALVVAAPRVASAQEATASDVVAEHGLKFDRLSTSDLATFIGHGFLPFSGVLVQMSAGVDGGYGDNPFRLPDKQALNSGTGLLDQTATLYITSFKNKNQVDPGVKPSKLAIEPDMTRDGSLGADSEKPLDSTPLPYDYEAGLRPTYHEYLSNDPQVRAQRYLSLHAFADLEARGNDPVSFIARDRFIRDRRGADFQEETMEFRDDNRLFAGIRIRPGQRNISMLYYQNWLTNFENGGGLNLPTRLDHTLGFRHEILAAPFTSVFGDISVGYFSTYGESNGMFYSTPFKTNSKPFKVTVGAGHRFTEQTFVRAEAGYAYASYDVGPGYSSPVIALDAGYKWSDTGRVVAKYRHDQVDALNANFYRIDLIQLTAVQQIKFVILDANGLVTWRTSVGVPAILGSTNRDDRLYTARARAQLVLADRWTLAAEYHYDRDHTDYVQNSVNRMGMIQGTYNPGFGDSQTFMLGVYAGY